MAPSVLKWFKVYCGFMVGLYILCILMGAAAFLIGPEELNYGRPGGEPVEVFYVMATVMLLLGLIFSALFAAPFFLDPKPGVWIFDTVLICIGFLSCLTLP